MPKITKMFLSSFLLGLIGCVSMEEQHPVATFSERVGIPVILGTSESLKKTASEHLSVVLNNDELVNDVKNILAELSAEDIVQIELRFAFPIYAQGIGLITKDGRKTLILEFANLSVEEQRYVFANVISHLRTINKIVKNSAMPIHIPFQLTRADISILSRSINSLNKSWIPKEKDGLRVSFLPAHTGAGVRFDRGAELLVPVTIDGDSFQDWVQFINNVELKKAG